MDHALCARAHTLTREQTNVAHAVAASPDRITCVVGAAGTGKTTAIAVGARALEDAGLVVVGAAPSAQAARTLAASADIHAHTLHALLADPRGIAPGSVVVVDEGSMGDTRTLSALIQKAEERDARLVLIGDTAQLPGGRAEWTVR